MSFSRPSFSIQARLALFVFMSLAVIMAIGFTSIVIRDIGRLDIELAREAETYGDLLTQDFVKITAFNSIDQATDITSRLHILPNVQSMILYDKKHQAVFHYRKNIAEAMPDTPEDWQSGYSLDDKSLISLRPLVYQGTNYGDILFRISTERMQHVQRNYMQQAGFFMLALLVVSVLLVWLIQRSFSRPILQLASAMKKAGESNDLTLRLVVSPGDKSNEIGELFNGFNSMQQQMQLASKALLDQQYALDQSTIVSMTDIDGNITYVNDYFLKITGYSRQELIGQNHRIIKSDLSSAEMFKEMWESISHGSLWRGELQNQTKDGNSWWVYTTIVPFVDQQGKVEQYLAAHFDISARKQAEMDLKKAELALQRTQKMDAIGQMAGGIAHDFNNILGIIIGNLDLAKLHVKDRSINGYLETIGKSATRATQLTRQLLNFSRMKGPGMVNINLNQTIMEMESLIRRSVTPSIEVSYKLSSDLWLTHLVPGDFQDALLNLVINARDAMPNGGKILIETVNIVLDPAAMGVLPVADSVNYLQVSVKDTGKGIPQEIQDNIFEPFFTTKPQGKGTGLGLAMVYGFAKRSGGLVKVDSVKNQGATFRIILPRKTGTLAPVVETAPVKILPRGSETLLLVDDEVELLNFASQTLRDLGYRIHTAENGSKALQFIIDKPEIVLVFTDMVMPGMDGDELAKQALLLKPSLRILFSSGYTEKTVSIPASSRLEDDLLSKPYDQFQLADHIRKILDQPRAGISPQSEKIPPHVKQKAIKDDRQWTQNKSVGIQALDDEHKYLLTLCHQIRQLEAEENTQQSELEVTVKQLLAFAAQHFRSEEEAMDACHFPGLENHKKVHQLMLREIERMKFQLSKGDLSVKQLADFLNSWLIDHIQEMDRIYGIFCQDKKKTINAVLKDP